MTKGNQ